MISAALAAEIVRIAAVERWPIGTIARHLHVHHSTVSRVLRQEGLPAPRRARPSHLEDYLPLIIETWRLYPRLPASRLYEMCQQRGYYGSPSHFRHLVAVHRPRPPAEAYLRLKTLPGEHYVKTRVMVSSSA